MKKLFAIVTTFALALALTACNDDNNANQGGNETSKPAVDNKLIVGTSDFSGNFLPGFGNSSYDVDVRTLIGGSETVSFTKENELIINPTVVVNDPVGTAVVDEDGNKTMTFEIAQDLTFSNGDPVKASDYVFGVNWLSSQAYKLAGASTSTGNEMVGYADWHAGCYLNDAGECNPDHDYDAEPLEFKGLKLVDEYTFSITIAAEHLPYFYELSLFGTSPVNAKILTQDGDYSMVNATAAEDGTYGNKDFGDFVKNFVSNPIDGLFAGAYEFVSYHPGQSVLLMKSDNFKGDYRGHTANIEKLAIKVVPNATDMEALIAGDIELLTGIVEGTKIDAGKEAGLAKSNYPRNGYGAVFFHTDFGPSGEKEIRQAISYIIDRPAFVDAFTGGYAQIVQGPYGLSQWMYKETVAADPNWETETLTNYVLSFDKANEALDNSTYKFEADGTTPFDASKASADYLRHNAAGEPLHINWMATDSEYTELLLPIMIRGVEKVGMSLTCDKVDFPTLLDAYYYVNGTEGIDGAGNPRKYHMFNLATGFGSLFDPYWSYHSDQYDTWMNSGQIKNDVIDRVTETMQKATTKDEFLAAWQEFQVEMNDQAYMVPLYSNDYHDLFNPKLIDLETDSMWDWTKAIIDAKIEGAE